MTDQAVRHGTVTTERSQEYAERIGEGWGSDAEVESGGATTVVRLADGSTVQVHAVPGSLVIEVTAADESDLDQLADKVERHLDRAASDEHVELRWRQQG